MVLNKRGQIFFTFMIGIVLFILGFALSSALITNNIQVRSNLDCGNVSIDTSQKVNCAVTDVIAPTITGLILGIGGMALVAKLQIG